MTEVQQLAEAAFFFIRRDDASLFGNAEGDDLDEMIFDLSFFKEGKDVFAAENGGFDGFGGAVGKDLVAQCIKGIGIAEHQLRLEKNAGQILPRAEINGGFAADGGIHGGQKGGGHLNTADAPQEHAGGKAGHIAGDAAAQSDNAIGAGQGDLA